MDAIILIVILLIWASYALTTDKVKQALSEGTESLLKDFKQLEQDLINDSHLQESDVTTSAPQHSTWVKPSQKERINYDVYIRSTAWANSKVRASCLSRDDYMCQMCKSPWELAVHHITYENLGNENVEDLATLCNKCHNYTHQRAGRGAKHYPPIKAP